MKKLTNQQAYEALTDAHVHWDRKDKNHIYVWTSGYKTAKAQEIERLLMWADMVVVNQQYDEISGKTVTTYKHK